MTSATAVRVRGIIFTAPNVRAIQKNQKFMTRRLVKKAYDKAAKETAFAVCPAAESGWIAWFGLPDKNIAEFTKQAYAHGFPCPYGKAGDRLYVRETWLPAIPGSWRPLDREEKMSSLWAYDPVYRADYQFGMDDYDGKWRPSIFMPRKFARIALEITDVRVERLQSISEEDAKAEGAESLHTCHWPDGDPGYIGDVYRRNFASLWESIHGKGSWETNPWVYAISFRKTTRPENR